MLPVSSLNLKLDSNPEDRANQADEEVAGRQGANGFWRLLIRECGAGAEFATRPVMKPVALAPALRGEGWGEGLFASARSSYHVDG